MSTSEDAVDRTHDVVEDVDEADEDEEAGEEDTELRDLVTHVLQSTGILGKIKVGSFNLIKQRHITHRALRYYEPNSFNKYSQARQNSHFINYQRSTSFMD